MCHQFEANRSGDTPTVNFDTVCVELRRGQACVMLMRSAGGMISIHEGERRHYDAQPLSPGSRGMGIVYI